MFFSPISALRALLFAQGPAALGAWLLFDYLASSSGGPPGFLARKGIAAGVKKTLVMLESNSSGAATRAVGPDAFLRR
jgi:hypothetical protein